MSAGVHEQRHEAAPGRRELLSFVVRSVAPNEVRLSRRGSWIPLDFAGVLQRLDRESGADAQPGAEVDVQPAVTPA